MPHDGLDAAAGPLHAASSPLQGQLLKAADHTALLHPRFFSVSLNDAELSYWESEAKHRAGCPARGGGTVIGAEEWWPKTPSISGLGAKADEKQYDGRRFQVRVLLAGGKVTCYHLVAHSASERLRWLTALVDTVSARAAAHDGVLRNGACEHAAVPSPSADVGGASAVDANTAAVQEALPLVWALWSGRDDEEGREQARHEYTELVRRHPSNWQVLQDRGNFHMRCGELRRAEADLTTAIDIHPTRAELWNDRAACRAQAGQHADALADTQEALALSPRFAQALSNQGNAYRALGHLAAAMDAYNAALLSDVLDARTWNNRGALQEECGNLVAAYLDIRRALELDPHNERAEANRERIATLLLESELELQPLKPIAPAAAASTGAAERAVLTEIPPPGAVNDVGSHTLWQPQGKAWEVGSHELGVIQKATG